uniref:Uncharacterized protein LOC104236277 n=1 Tax=Nicotiana sylvestris TaxID=4096 RepID=A0A1U7XNE9_NICSY|nr:PREDICTED: uncharacterized protein LOC104236277 [Nicotiana sylvestris]
MDTLNKYEKISGQNINKGKSCYMLKVGASLSAITRANLITGMHFKEFPIEYLGCPLFVGRLKISYYSDLINKVTSRAKGWQTKLLSTGGKEGGANFRNLQDINDAFTAKMWWNLRSGDSLWREFMLAKYCKRAHVVISQERPGQSNSWKALCGIKKKVEQSIVRLPMEGKISFWYDNWTKEGPLYKLMPEGLKPKNVLLKDISEVGNWLYDRVEEEIPSAVKNVVEQHLVLTPGVPDKAIWTANLTGNFSEVLLRRYGEDLQGCLVLQLKACNLAK